MRGSIARSFALSLALAYWTAGHQASAAPRPKPPPPPAQGTITISYFGAGSITETPIPDAIYNSTLDLDYREVFRVTSGAYDKAAGTIDLVGSGTIAYQYAESGDTSVIQEYFCGYSGLWYRDEKSSGRYTAERSGTYATGVHRRGTMSSGSQGVLHIGRYPGSDLANPDWSNLPLVSWTQVRKQSTHYKGKDENCYPANPDSSGDSSTSSNTSGLEVLGVFPDLYIAPVPPVPVTLDRKGHLTGNETFLLRWGNSGFNRPNIPVVVVVSVDVQFAQGLVADPGGPYSVPRGEPVTLDAGASRTLDGIAIQSYSWSWAPGSNCPPGTTLANTTTGAWPGAMRTIIPICNLEVTVTVKDAKRRVATATTFVTVRRRQGDFASTPVTTSTADGIPSEFGGDRPPLIAGLVGGVNVADCANPQPAVFESPWFCPAPTNLGGGRGTWLDNGYTIGNVGDPGGPFDGFAWITSTDIVAARKVYINNYLRSGGPMPVGASENFYTANSNAGYDVSAFVAAVEAHEGEGTTINRLAGHTGALRNALTQFVEGIPIDPRRRIEGLVAPNRSMLQTSADAQLVASEHALCVATADPIAIVWSGTILLWDNASFFPSWKATPMVLGGQGNTQC